MTCAQDSMGRRTRTRAYRSTSRERASGERVGERARFDSSSEAGRVARRATTGNARDATRLGVADFKRELLRRAVDRGHGRRELARFRARDDDARGRTRGPADGAAGSAAIRRRRDANRGAVRFTRGTVEGRHAAMHDARVRGVHDVVSRGGLLSERELASRCVLTPT